MLFQRIIVLVLIFSYNVLDVQSGPIIVDDCSVRHDFNSPYIASYHDRPITVTGCDSKDVKSNTHTQVHIFRLVSTNINHVREGSRQQVLLNLRAANSLAQAREAITTRKPLQNVVGFKDPLVIVLHSDVPVVWKIDIKNITNTSRPVIMLDRNSRLDKSSKRLPLDIRVRKRDLPDTQPDLMSYIRQEYEAVTSYAEFSVPYSITKYITPVNSSLPSGCSASFNHVSQSSVVHHRDVQDIIGCSATWNKNVNGKDVHILELESAGLYSNVPTDATPVVSVTLKVEDRENKNTHTVLILSSHQRVRWHIITERIRGTLDIIADHSVDTSDVKLQTVRVTAEKVLTRMQGSDLRVWVRERYGPAVSYTQARSANHFDITLDAEDPEMSRMPEGNVLANDVPPLAGGPPGSPGSDAITYLQHAIAASLSLKCGSDSLQVTIGKHLLQMYEITRMDVSLLDTNCIATSNVSHYVIDEGFTECDTRQTVHTDYIRYQNALVLHHRGLQHLRDVFYQTDDLHDASLFVNGHTDVNFSNVIVADKEITIPVHCSIEQNGPWALPSTNTSLQYNLQIFEDESFNQRLSYPIEKRRQSLIYVEATVTGDPRLRGVIENCAVVAHEGKANEVKHPLIVKGCEIDRSVHWYNKASLARLSDGPPEHISGQRFHFTVYDYSDTEELMYLKCTINVCSVDSNYVTKHIHQCVPQEQFCLMQNVLTPDNSNRPLAFQRVIDKGPMTITPIIKNIIGNPSLNGDVMMNTHPISPAKACEQIVRVEGLDSGTVIGIAFAAFIIGVLLTAILWFIHTHTGMLHAKAIPQSLEHSGESTPSSTTAFTHHSTHA